jgi:hypothetical protein
MRRSIRMTDETVFGDDSAPGAAGHISFRSNCRTPSAWRRITAQRLQTHVDVSSLGGTFARSGSRKLGRTARAKRPRQLNGKRQARRVASCRAERRFVISRLESPLNGTYALSLRNLRDLINVRSANPEGCHHRRSSTRKRLKLPSHYARCFRPLNAGVRAPLALPNSTTVETRNARSQTL